MSPQELAARCLLRVEMRTLPVDVRLMVALTRGTYLYTVDQALFAGAKPEDLAVITPSVPAATCEWQADSPMDRRTVVYLPEADPVRLRFTLAHELGHIALKHGRGPTPRMERDADAFARALLMPPPLVRALLRERGALYAEQLAFVFGVSTGLAMNALPAPALPPDRETAMCDLLLSAALARIPPRVSPRWHRLIPPAPDGTP